MPTQGLRIAGSEAEGRDSPLRPVAHQHGEAELTWVGPDQRAHELHAGTLRGAAASSARPARGAGRPSVRLGERCLEKPGRSRRHPAGWRRARDSGSCRAAGRERRRESHTGRDVPSPIRPRRGRVSVHPAVEGAMRSSSSLAASSNREASRISNAPPPPHVTDFPRPKLRTERGASVPSRRPPSVPSSFLGGILDEDGPIQRRQLPAAGTSAGVPVEVTHHHRIDAVQHARCQGIEIGRERARVDVVEIGFGSGAHGRRGQRVARVGGQGHPPTSADTGKTISSASRNASVPEAVRMTRWASNRRDNSASRDADPSCARVPGSPGTRARAPPHKGGSVSGARDGGMVRSSIRGRAWSGHDSEARGLEKERGRRSPPRSPLGARPGPSERAWNVRSTCPGSGRERARAPIVRGGRCGCAGWGLLCRAGERRFTGSRAGIRSVGC